MNQKIPNYVDVLLMAIVRTQLGDLESHNQSRSTSAISIVIVL